MIGIALSLALAFAAGDGAPDEPAVDSVVATIDGQAITASELGAYAGPAEGEHRIAALRELVLRRLVDARAKEAGVRVDDDRLADAMRKRVEATGGATRYTEFLEFAKRTRDQDRAEVARALAGYEYVSQCLGEVPGSPLARPHLARSLAVTTRELRECFAANRHRFGTPGEVELVLVLASKPAFPDAAAARVALTAAIEGRSASDLEAAAAAGKGLTARRERFTDERLASLVEPLRDFARSGGPEAVSAIAETENAFLAAGIVGRQAPVEPSFDEALPAVERHLRATKRAAAEQQLFKELLGEADVWPRDLFPGT
jgi:hypothetical protein